MHRFGNELDHLGIVLLIWGTGISGTHFAFYCDDALRNAYFLVLTMTAVGCSIFTLRPKFRQPTYRTVRFLVYCILGSMFAPVLHGWMIFGHGKLNDMIDLGTFFRLAAINFTGAAVYAARIPERWFPKVFDLLGQSHNWMHILVWTRALVRLNGLLVVAESWRERTSRHGLCQGFP
jgi:adiponectin receptor